MKKFISNEEILKNALRTEDDVVDEDLKKMKLTRLFLIKNIL